MIVMDIDFNELSMAQQTALKQFVQTLNNRVDTIYIFCFALTRYESHHIHCFAPHTHTQGLQADILLVCGNRESRSTHEIQHLAASISTAAYQYTAVAVHHAEAMRRLESGDPFVCKVFSHAALLYSSGEALPRRQRFVCRKTLLEQTRVGWRRWFNTSCQFMDCAAYCLMDGNFGLAIFMVHQTVEQACKAVIKVMLHMRPNTHNIAWMLKLCGSLIPEIHTIFPRDTPREKALFNLLKGSYIDCRYGTSFDVQEEEAWALYYRASALLRVAGEWCNRRIQVMEALVQEHVCPASYQGTNSLDFFAISEKDASVEADKSTV